ncbi:MAG: methyltransferase [Rhodospirillales bacterium]|nr:methyltransferase [Rhodospirillales bacterium]MCW8862375.1 methyltransferase [Rhodospirillales bacterium]MCW8951820.1 methyltransferase [Rhodospirillales bacterium]MCW8970995.1 methyltransferase [Rhodospirillales bacterium]MCW9001394.1 methyltransferase [Rhodospirillales bacterium]
MSAAVEAEELAGAREDTLLGGRVRLLQPVAGYRAAIDPVLLAAAVPAKDGQLVLDVGLGVGAAALCLASRCSGVRVTGIEIQPELAALARNNAELNEVSGRVEVVVGDIVDPPESLRPDSFDHVMTNPPYQEAGRGNVPPVASKAAANVEGDADLQEWIKFCVSMVRSRGSITIIHRADRLDAILACLSGRVGEVVITPLWPGPEKAARRVIVRGRKGVKTPLTLSPGLILHTADGGYTDTAEAILRDGVGL